MRAFCGNQGHGEEKQRWAKQLGKLIYAIEHQRALLHEVVRQAARDAELPLGLEELEPPLFGDEPTYAIGCDPLPGQHYAHDLATWAVEGGSAAAGRGVAEHPEQAAGSGEEDAALMHFSPLSGDSQQLELLVPTSNDPGQPQQDQQQQSQQLQVICPPTPLLCALSKNRWIRVLQQPGTSSSQSSNKGFGTRFGFRPQRGFFFPDILHCPSKLPSACVSNGTDACMYPLQTQQL